MDYEKDIVIDENALDIEWLDQPKLMLKYTRNSAKMRMLVDKAKQDLDIAKAEADKRIRKRPEKFGLEKITEAAVMNAILIEEGYQEAYALYLEAKYESDMASGAVIAFEQRKSALENMVRLYNGNYFAGPKIPRNITEERQMRQEKTDAGVAAKFVRKKETE